MQPGGSNLGGLGFGGWAKYAHTLFTSDVIIEGDRILKSGVYYDVHSVNEYWNLDNFEHHQCELLRLENFTLQTLTLSTTPDATTGIYGVSFSTGTTIKGNLSVKGQSAVSTSTGLYNKYDYTLITSSTVYEGDRIKDSNNVVYEVRQVTLHPSSRTDYTFKWSVCGLTKTEWGTRASTTGTWHLNSISLKTDVRYRWKHYFEKYITPGNVTKDNGATVASTLFSFSGIDYHLTQVFLTKLIDAEAIIRVTDSKPLKTDHNFGDAVYAFEELAEIQLYAVNKAGLTAFNLLEKFEQEIRHVITDYPRPYINIRSITSSKEAPIDLGPITLYSVVLSVSYKRANDDYVATLPTITWGPSASATGTYIWPNVTNFKIVDPDSGDVKITSPSRIGNILQIMGSDDFEIVLTSDLSMEHFDLTWKRPQTTSPKTDMIPYQVFEDIKFNGKTDNTKIYQTFNYGGGSTIPVRVTDFTVDDNEFTVVLRRYTVSNASSGTYKQWYGTS